MKKLKILCAVLSVTLVILLGILAFLIMNRGSENVDIFKYYEKGSFRQYSMNEIYLKFIGRSAAADDGIILSHSGSGISFICKGDYAEITVKPENSYVNSSHYPRIAIYSDGNLVADECIGAEKTYRIDTAYSGTEIKLIKLSEAMHSSLKVTGVSSYGMEDISPSQEKLLKIEFIGDSITCGYGVDGNTVGYFTTATENFSRTYAYLTAQKLDADYSAVCYSGYGVLSGYSVNGVRNDKKVMNEYDKACHISGQDDPLWDFTRVSNDVVVINLGTNDASYCSSDSYRRQQFAEEYVKMLCTVREKNPEAYILCILGDMNNSLYSSIEAAVSQYTALYFDSRVQAFPVEFRMGENDVVIDGHPGALSNMCAAEMLTEKIKELVGYGFIER